MRILVIQFAARVRGRPVPRFEPQLGGLLTLLKQRGHELALSGAAEFDEARLKADLARHLPQLVYADISAVCVDAARRTLHHIQQREFLPVVAGGQFPTVDPKASLSLPAVHAVAIGEPDATLVTYLERIRDPSAGQVVSGVWVRDETGLARPAMPQLVEDLDSLPLAERELFDYADHVRRTGEVEIAVGRGCPQSCAYCINDWIESLYGEDETWVRRRSAEGVLEEIDLLRRRYADVTSVRFVDHAFALDGGWLEGFLSAYAARCGLPFRCHVRANSAEGGLIERLARAGCRFADVEVISGSDFIRNEIFDMNLSAEQIVATFGALRAAGVRTRAVVYLGAPYESEASLEETHALLKRLAPDAVDARAYYPWPGTRARAIAEENGWLHPRGEDQYHRGECGIQMPACKPQVVAAALRRLRREFRPTGGTPWWRRWARRGGRR